MISMNRPKVGSRPYEFLLHYNKRPTLCGEDLFSLVPITQHIMSGFQLKKKSHTVCLKEGKLQSGKTK